jgi:hypothetical protein
MLADKQLQFGTSVSLFIGLFVYVLLHYGSNVNRLASDYRKGEQHYGFFTGFSIKLLAWIFASMALLIVFIAMFKIVVIDNISSAPGCTSIYDIVGYITGIINNPKSIQAVIVVTACVIANGVIYAFVQPKETIIKNTLSTSNTPYHLHTYMYSLLLTFTLVTSLWIVQTQ